jgi:prefoldin subunit 5
MKKKNRFDLEQEINELHIFAEQINSLKQAISKYNLSKKETAKALDGLKVLVNIHSEKMFNTMKDCFNLER